MRPKGWSDLPPDLLREIAGRLHVAADFVSFHAVCNPWRSYRGLLSGTTTQLLPWFLAPTEKHGQSPLKLRCIFSKSSYHGPYPRRRNWVCSATDGATVGYVTVKQLRPTLHDPNTGAVTDLPRFPYYFHYPWEENPCGIVYGDGTIFLYGIARFGNERRCKTLFRAAFLRPGDAEWMLVDRTFETNDTVTEFCSAYHRGRFLVSMEFSLWRVVAPDDGGGDVLVPSPYMAPDEPGSRWEWEMYSYVLESHGELLWASVQVQLSSGFAPRIKTFLVSVHALEEAAVPEEVRWVEKEGHCLADRVLFLGSPNSFAVDASILGGEGGCAYFVYHNTMIKTPEQLGLFRYNFIDGKTERIQRLPEEWDDGKCTWLVPQPTIAPIQQLIRRKLQSQKLKKHQKAAPITSPSCIFHIERHYEHRFRVLVHNLPLKVKSSQLQLFFSAHGKVSSTEIIYNKNTKTSKGIIKIATMHAHEEDAIAALHGLDFEGCKLKVILVNDRQGQTRRKTA